MFTLNVVFTGLVFFAQAPNSPKFTNAVLVTGTSDAEMHHAEFRIAQGTVTVKQGGKPVTKDHWELGPDAIVVIESGTGGPPERLLNFMSHVPSVGNALADTPLSKKTVNSCTWAAAGDCEYQNGRIRMSGGTLDASVLSVDHEYPFLTREFSGRYWSRIASTTMWQGKVNQVTIKEHGVTYVITADTDVVIHAGSHPKHADAHFEVLRHLYDASNDDFPGPLDIYGFFVQLSKYREIDARKLERIRTESRPVLCPPAVQ